MADVRTILQIVYLTFEIVYLILKITSLMSDPSTKQPGSEKDPQSSPPADYKSSYERKK